MSNDINKKKNNHLNEIQNESIYTSEDIIQTTFDLNNQKSNNSINTNDLYSMDDKHTNINHSTSPNDSNQSKISNNDQRLTHHKELNSLNLGVEFIQKEEIVSKSVKFSSNEITIPNQDEIMSTIQREDPSVIEEHTVERKGSFSRRRSVHSGILSDRKTLKTYQKNRKRALTIDTTPISFSSHVLTSNRSEKKIFEFDGFAIGGDGVITFPNYLSSSLILMEYLKNVKKIQKLSNSKSRLEEYKTIKLIGEGHSSRVSLVKDIQTENQFARKTIYLSHEIPPFMVTREITAMLLCHKCPNIIQFVDAYFDGFSIHIISEYIEGLNLESISIIEEKIADAIIFQALKGINCLHKRRVLHMDIKLGNMILTKIGSVFIHDFGLSLYLPEDQDFVDAKYSSEGSLSYLAPEKIQNSNFGFESDIWSLGISALKLVSGFLPQTSMEKYYYSMENILCVPDNLETICGTIKISNQYKDFIRKALTIDSRKRPSAETLLKHEIFNDLNMEKSEKILKQYLKENQKSSVH